MSGKLIVIEGPDGVGKGTQSRLLVEALTNRGIRAVRAEPTKDSLQRCKKMIYSMLESGSARSHPNTYQMVQFINRAYFSTFRLPELLRNNQLVILDRWSLSGYVYGKCEGVNTYLNELILMFSVNPDLTLILEGCNYTRPNWTDDSYESDSNLQAQVTQEYSRIASLPGHLRVDNMGSIQEVHEEIVGILRAKGLLTKGSS